MIKKKFNLLSGAIYEYRVVMDEKILSDNAHEQHDACVTRATDFATFINGWARGCKDKQNGLFDVAVPQAPAPKEFKHEKSDRPMLKIFATPKVMRRIQAEFSGRIKVIVRVGRWNEKGLVPKFHAWQHPRRKKAEDIKSSPTAFSPEGYT